MPKVGLSLSYCVADILDGRVPLAEVDHIVSGTVAQTPEDWDTVIATYRKVYWQRDPDTAEGIVRAWLALDKIDQPRLRGIDPGGISGGWWVNAGEME
jgi:hypothetical protein